MRVKASGQCFLLMPLKGMPAWPLIVVCTHRQPVVAVPSENMLEGVSGRNRETFGNLIIKLKMGNFEEQNK